MHIRVPADEEGIPVGNILMVLMVKYNNDRIGVKNVYKLKSKVLLV
jgi:hypothetical protein